MLSTYYRKSLLGLFVLLFLFLLSGSAAGITNIDFEKLFEEHGSVMLIVEPESGRIIYANQVASDFYGYEKDTLISMNISEINTLNEEEIAEEIALARSEQRNHFIFPHQKSSGEIVTVEVMTYPSDLDGMPVLFSVIKDITDEEALFEIINARNTYLIIFLSTGLIILAALIFLLKKNLDKQRKSLELTKKSEEKFKNYIENAPDGISVVNENGALIVVNQALVRMTGYSRDELLSMTSFDLVDTKIYPKMKEGFATLKKEGLLEIQYEMTKKDGETRFWEVKRVQLDEENFIGFIKDITELKEYEKELIEAKNKAEEANLAKSQFLANMSHEIRTPMNGIMGFLQILESEATTDDQQKQFKKIRISAENLLSLINNILDSSKYESGSFVLDQSIIPLQETIEESLRLYQTTVDEKGLTLCQRYDDNLPEFVLGDSYRLQQIINNLLSNAIKFTGRGYVCLIVKQQTKNMISFTIEDTGIGIASDPLAHIFEMFMQEDASTTREYGGTGLGLPIVKHLVELMNGSIHIESEKGSGTKVHFCIRLPEAKEANSDGNMSHTISSQESKKPGDIKILLVEDDEISAEIFKKMLSIHHLKADLAKNGIEAIELFGKNAYDLIFMDCQMPVMDGYQATRKIREMEKNLQREKTPIVALTAHALKEDHFAAIDSGMDDYLTKPANMNIIIETIEKYTGYRKS